MGKERPKKTKNEELRRQYHPVFCDAMTQILEQDSCKYEYEREYNLNSMPNRIDLLVIKKRAVSASGKGIGKIFRKYNIFEYKSPGQSMGISEYHKVMAYAHLYAGMERVRLEELTISFVREGEPKKLLAYFKENGFEISEPEKGIYHLKRKYHPDMQILVTKNLGDEYIWLRVLSKNVSTEDIRKLAAETKKEQNSEGNVRIRSILNLVSELNQGKNLEKEMDEMGIVDMIREQVKEEYKEKIQQIAEQEKEIQTLNVELRSRDEQLQSKDEQLQSKDEQLQSKDEQLQSKDEQLQSKDEQLQYEQKENSRLQKEIEELKKQLGKIAVL